MADASAPSHDCTLVPPQVMPQQESSPEEAPKAAREASLPIKFGIDMLAGQSEASGYASGASLPIKFGIEMHAGYLLADQKPLVIPQLLPLVRPHQRWRRGHTRGGAKSLYYS